MVNFGYPYNDIVICKDSTDYLSKSQIDVAILDFSKAFDTVPHAGLLGKLEHYGIDSKILLWITNFLNNRKQRVVSPISITLIDSLITVIYFSTSSAVYIVKANHLQPVQRASINKTSLNILHLTVLFIFTDFY